jgi:hypothetical protein
VRRQLGALIVLVLLAGACARDQDPAVAPPTEEATTVPGGGDAGGPVETTPSGEAVVPPAPETTVTPTTAAPGDGLVATGPPGSFAPAFLRPGRGDRIVVEVATQAGAEPQGSTLDHVTEVLAQVSQKQVTLAGAGTPPADDSWTSAEIRAAFDAVAATAQDDRAAVLRLMFVHGRFAEDDNVLGVAVRGDAAAIFVDGMDEAATPLVGAGAIEVATTTHEVGHLLGLVDLVLDTGRADPEHPGHSSNEDSVMYWAVESTLVTDLLAGGPPRNFDGDDLADLARIRSGS